MTLPGNLTSPRAGPILCRCAPAIVIKTGWRGIVDFVAVDANEHRPGMWARFLYDDDGEERGGYVWGADPLPEPRPLDVIRLAAIGLDLTADLGPTIALRWLGRHYGIDVGMTAPEWGAAGWGIWDLRARDGSHVGFTADATTAKKFSDPKRGIVHHVPALANITNPLEALTTACLHAAGVSRE